MVEKNDSKKKSMVPGKYTYGSIRMQLYRKKVGYTSEQAAELSNMTLERYVAIESGAVIPNRGEKLLLSKMLNLPFETVDNWFKEDEKVLFEEEGIKEGANKYLDEWNVAVENCMQRFKKMSGRENIKTPVKFFKTLKRDVDRTFYLPILPLTLIVITDVIFDENNKHEYLHEYTDFIGGGESMPAYAARESSFGGFAHTAANTLFFHKNPSVSIMDCFNRLTRDQFTDLLYHYTVHRGVYTDHDKLPDLQRFNEFSSLGALMVRNLKSYLPKSVDYDHLYMAVLLQAVGIYALRTTLLGKINLEKCAAPGEEFDFNDAFIRCVEYEMHQVIAGIIVAKWGFSEKIVKTIIEHHDQPSQEVPETDATFKLVNEIVNLDFRVLFKEDLAKILQKYPQVTIPVESLLKVTTKMSELSNHLIEADSRAVEQKVKDVNEVISNKIKLFVDQEKIVKDSEDVIILKKAPKAKDVRFHPEYCRALSVEAQFIFSKFLTKKLLPQRHESLEKYTRRIQDLQLQNKYLHTRDTLVVADSFKISEEEVKQRLGLE